ncbi:MAG: hypothetical protein ACI4RD_06950 [Kiritimatiellia bacterium]
MKVVTYQLLLAAALLAGVAIGYCTAGKDSGPAAAAKTEAVAGKPVEDVGEAASLRALRRRIAELEKALAERAGKAETAISNAVAEALRNAPPEPGRPRLSPREWAENLRKTDPGRYAKMTNRVARWRQRRAEQTRNTLDFLASIDTSHMSAGARQTHDALQDLLARREELEARMHQEELSDEERDALRREMGETQRELRRLNDEERRNLIDETAKSLGFEGEDAQAISSTIQEVVRATEAWGGDRHPGPPPGGPGGPGGPAGGR